MSLPDWCPDDAPTCTRWSHIFLDGRMRCECGAVDYDDLVEVVTGMRMSDGRIRRDGR